MYDVNNHPEQEKVNAAIGNVLGDTIIQLNQIADKYEIDRLDVFTQFTESCGIIVNHDNMIRENRQNKEADDGSSGEIIPIKRIK